MEQDAYHQGAARLKRYFEQIETLSGIVSNI
jgi:hypothetical protein